MTNQASNSLTLPKQLLTVRQAADTLSVSDETIRIKTESVRRLLAEAEGGVQ